MLEAINLGCVRGSRRLFTQLNFCAQPGELIEVRGPNGSGKTSLLRILCGLASAAEGEVRWNGTDTRTLGEEYHAAIAYLAHQNGLKDELSAVENLTIAGGLRGNASSALEAPALLEKCGIGDERELPTRLLSAGQRRRVALARLLVSRATLWILDEVLASLDDAAVATAQELLADHLNGGGIAVATTHHQIEFSKGPVQRIQLSA